MKAPINAGIGLFCAAAAAFAFGLYALGAWLAVGSIACAALVLTATWREDRPATVAALRAVEARLESAENRLTYLVTTFTSAFPARVPQGSAASNGRPVSPVRPPAGSR